MLIVHSKFQKAVVAFETSNNNVEIMCSFGGFLEILNRSAAGPCKARFGVCFFNFQKA